MFNLFQRLSTFFIETLFPRDWTFSHSLCGKYQRFWLMLSGWDMCKQIYSCSDLVWNVVWKMLCGFPQLVKSWKKLSLLLYMQKKSCPNFILLCSFEITCLPVCAYCVHSSLTFFPCGSKVSPLLFYVCAYYWIIALSSITSNYAQPGTMTCSHLFQRANCNSTLYDIYEFLFL